VPWVNSFATILHLQRQILKEENKKLEDNTWPFNG
jgi:hypothetical protein